MCVLLNGHISMLLTAFWRQILLGSREIAVVPVLTYDESAAFTLWDCRDK
jgi:hypothetical protein